jgi:hypothetical protein
MLTFSLLLIEPATVTVVHSWLFNFCEINESPLHFFHRNAGISASAFVSLNPRLGTVQQLFRSHAGNNDETKPGVNSRPGSFIRHAS